jgi:NAD(P)-dependent dehydrogenase (short-subunit alcohol dehydrogenase family)
MPRRAGRVPASSVPRLDLAGRFALVTGAAGAIGGATVTAFTASGARCLAVDRRAGRGVRACDVTDERSVAAAFAAARRLGALTDVVHAAGVVSLGRVAELPVAEFRRVLEVNLVGSFLVAREAARRLGPGGTLTLISSQGGLRAGAGWSAYCAAKAGVNRLAEALAQELGPAGIRVNALCPGNVDTAMADEAIAANAAAAGAEPADLRARYLAGIPLGRFADPAEIGWLCAMLASPLASYVSGAKLVADGGELS